VIGRAPVSALLVLACTACSARAARPPWVGTPWVGTPWVGTWRMAAVESRDSSAGPWRRPFGDAPYGFVMYNTDGTHAMNFSRTPVPPRFPGGDRGATERELRETYDGYFSWFGRYTVDTRKGVIIHHIEGSLWPSWRNTVQERPFEIRGDTLLLGDQVRSRRVLVRLR